MRKLLAAAITLMATSAWTAEATHPFSVHDMLAMQRVSDPRVSPDGRSVIFTLRTTDLEANKGRTDLWLAAVDGTEAHRLTTHPESDSSGRWSSSGKLLYFLSTRDGSSEVWRIRMEGGEAMPVTRLPIDVENLEIAPDGSFAVFSLRVFPGTSPEETVKRQAERSQAKTTGRLFERLFIRHWDAWEDGTRNHLFSFRFSDGHLVDLMRDMDADCPSRPFGGSEEFAISPDGRSVVFAAKDVGREEAWSTNFDLYSVPADGSSAPVKLTSNPAWDTQPTFSPDGKTLAYLAMSRAGYEADRFDVVLRPWPEGTERKLTLRADASPLGDRSPREIAWSRDGRELYCTAAHLGQVALFALDVASGETRMLVGEGTTLAPQDAAGNRVLFGMHSLQGPTELYSVARGGGEPARVTRINDERLAQARLGEPEPFTFEGAQGATVYGYLVRPVDFDASRKYPVAFLIHGGPQGSFGNDFHYRWNPQAYAGAGYAAVMIDFHGSVGYGQDFTDAINNDWGGKPYEDLMQGLDHALTTYPFLDGERVCGLGASFGGFMVNWIAGKTDRFDCLVNHDGNLDERMAYFATEELWFPEWDHQGVPWENPHNYAKHNPVELVGRWAEHRTPMLVIHGALDFRIPDTQGIATFTALQRLGIPSQLLWFPDENHWVLSPANSVQWHETVIGWLDRWLKPEAAGSGD
jgi:dipeptidyl aminopeptidase/acylaminoacyl peptidase